MMRDYYLKPLSNAVEAIPDRDAYATATRQHAKIITDLVALQMSRAAHANNLDFEKRRYTGFPLYHGADEKKSAVVFSCHEGSHSKEP